jgi:hypothetical protein
MLKTEVKHTFDNDEGKEWLRGILHDETIKDLCITFTKKDGTERKMRPTLIESRIPSEKQPKTETVSQTSGSAIRVFDTEVQEWRSFRWDSITKVSFDL